MPADNNSQNGSSRDGDLKELARTIDKAQRLASAGGHKFLTYLLDMARLEVSNLQAKNKD